jgi:hypothetical protein
VNVSGSTIHEVVPWRTRAARRVRAALVDIRAWLFGWGVGGVLVGSLLVIVVGYFALATFGADRVPVTPCHRAQGLVDQISTVQRHEHKAPLDRSMVRRLHRIGAQLKPVADDAYGSVADSLHSLATTATAAKVGDHLEAEEALSQEYQLCR